MTDDMIPRSEALAMVAAERERCAKIALSVPYHRKAMLCGCSEGLAEDIAAAIRATTDTQEGEK